MKKHWISLAYFMALATIIPLRAQTSENLVYNSSFEEYRHCPTKIDAMGVMREADAWWQPTGGSSDYFNACGGRECNVPRNKMGFQEAHSGTAYCGIYCSQEQYREYLQTELKTPLRKGKRYRVSFWTSLAEKSPHAVATLGAVLTPERIEDSARGILMEKESKAIGNNGSQSIATFFTPQVVNIAENVIDNTKEWIEVSGEFIAKGGERFLTIGNFYSFNRSNVVSTNGTNTPLPGAYYYIDDIEVICLDSIETTSKPKTEEARVGKIVILENIFFATGESEVLQQSYNELMKLKELLESNPSMQIELRGHTDNQGTKDYNQKLSEARAKAVVDYLVERGIDRSRLTSIGYGKSQPIADNATSEGRQQNRRVEYRVVSK
jgi:outer membrane protein OmpA-like peptidoglycan-associated protein